MATISNPTFISTTNQSILVGHGGGAVASVGDEITCAFISGTAIIQSITNVAGDYRIEILPTNGGDWSLSPTHPYAITGGSMIGGVLSHVPPTFADWTIGAGNNWSNYDIASPQGVVGVFPGAPITYGNNMIKQSGVFTDWALGTVYTVTVEVAADADHQGGATLYFGDQTIYSSYGAVYYDATTPPPSTIFSYSHVATNDVFALEITNGSLAILSVTITSESETLSLIAHPQELTPAYNPSVWYFDSANKTKPGYRYFVQILNAADDSIIAQERYVPTYPSGYAQVDVTRILKNFVSYDYSTGGIQKIPNSWFGYKIRVYDEYQIPYEYYDFQFGVDGAVNLKSLTNVHFFNVGDQILVSQNDGGALKPGLEGLQTVGVPSATGTGDLYLTLPFAAIGSGTVMGGSVVYADGRKTISPVYYETEVHYVFNGALPFKDFPTYDQADWIVDTSTCCAKWLTSIPRGGFYIYETQQINLNYANWFDNTNIIYFENSNGDLFEYTLPTNSILFNGQFTTATGGWPTVTQTISGATATFSLTANRALYDADFDAPSLTFENSVTSLAIGNTYVVGITVTDITAPFTNMSAVLKLGDTLSPVITTTGYHEFIMTCTGTGVVAIFADNDGQGGSMEFENMTVVPYENVLELDPIVTAQVDPSTIMTDVLVGTAPLVKPDTEWYDVWIDEKGQVTEKIRFYIDRRCKINDYEIKFMDRMGSFASFSFELRSVLTNNNNKSTYKQLVGGLGSDIAGPAYTYELSDFGEKVFDVNFTQTLQLNTNWMDDASSVYFQELITSPVTYLKIDTDVYVPVIVTTSSSIEQRQRDKRLIRYTIEVRYSNATQNINI